eukprot:1138546-Pelagomonas_calceolata.AAC.2
MSTTDVRLRALELLSSSSSPSYKPKDAALPSRSISVALPAAAANEARSAVHYRKIKGVRQWISEYVMLLRIAGALNLRQLSQGYVKGEAALAHA